MSIEIGLEEALALCAGLFIALVHENDEGKWWCEVSDDYLYGYELDDCAYHANYDSATLAVYGAWEAYVKSKEG